VSTYEALINLYSGTCADFKKLCEEADDLVRISGRISELINDGVVDLGGSYSHRTEMNIRRLTAARGIGSESLEEVGGLLREVDADIS
jgi:hypothetical protein